LSSSAGSSWNSSSRAPALSIASDHVCLELDRDEGLLLIAASEENVHDSTVLVAAAQLPADDLDRPADQWLEHLGMLNQPLLELVLHRAPFGRVAPSHGCPAPRWRA
jgi:hypothetical protein